MKRRELLRAGLTGFSTLALSQVLQARQLAQLTASPRPTSIILVWLRGGASHLDTLDPKPDAPTEYRGPFRPIATTQSGVWVTELLPQLARLAHRYSLVRSLVHTGGGHPAGSLQMLSGDADAADKPKPVLPDWMSVASYLRRDASRAIPNYVAVNPVDRYDNFVIAGPAYLGPAYEPFQVTGDPSSPTFTVPNIGVGQDGDLQRLKARTNLKQSFERLKRDLGANPMMEALDRFEQQALNLLTSPTAREAFDLTRESDATRDRYGRHRWGQQCLLARRLVEAGVDVVTTEFDGPLCGRVANWDDHAVNHHVFDALRHRAPYFDQAVSALIEDVFQRGLDQRVMVVVTGEFGRTPRISYVASSGGGVASAEQGVIQPGRDHWPRAGSMLFAGGGVSGGNVVGATDAKGEDIRQRPVSPGDFLATLYQHLGIDYRRVAIRNFAGRPVPIVNRGDAIHELWS